ncbi:type VI secretion system Vgr family protein [uncultured Litoreibacter sp.]|uniref:type VI secretion system Vgr family protein n=1 Tax=uncultured Litoreibacter sp. TaxID=1392394 RepID=UPI002619DC2A|nr:type VI secretion system tip protein TssI/VgrG [uncultured Litoreibacter sp.]
MNAIFSQDARLGQLTTVLGKDVLVLLRFTGTDYVNDLFEYTVDCLSTQQNIDFDQIIGTHASVQINSQNNGPRHFDGIVTQAIWSGAGENGHKYQLTLRPWFWLAGRRRNQRIFHNMTVVQIIEKLLQPYAALGDPALQVDLVEDYRVLEYTVQYRESDMEFAMRLMERFGISYHFRHAHGSHTLVLTDAVDSHDMVAGSSRVYKPYDGHHNTEAEHFWGWFPERRLTTGAMRLTDYNFKTPNAAMEVDRTGDAKYEQGQIESYDYPGDYLEQGVGKDVVGLRTLAERGQDRRHRAVGDCTSLGAGMRLSLTGDHVDGVKGADYLCLTASHSYVSDAYGTMDGEAQKQGSDGYAYKGAYVLMPVTAPLAPERKTRIPVVQGPQTAVVVGEGEIDCDEYGRILVHFHWDLDAAYSMRCRVSQNWASKGWGGMIIPRIGMEVMVEFLEGDPDKPIVTGCVYNGQNDAPYELPKHKTKSVFRSDTHKGTGYNEITFEDERNEEEIYVHGQKDQNIHIENHRAKRIDRSQSESVGNHKTIEVARHHKEAIGGNMRLVVGAAKNGQFGARSLLGETSPLAYKDSFLRKTPYQMDRLLDADATRGNMEVIVSGNNTLSVAQTMTEKIGKARISSVYGMRQDYTKGTLTEHVDGNRIAQVGKAVRLQAGTDITFQVGGASIMMSSDGKVRISGSDIEVLGSSSIVMKAPRIDLN